MDREAKNSSKTTQKSNQPRRHTRPTQLHQFPDASASHAQAAPAAQFPHFGASPHQTAKAHAALSALFVFGNTDSRTSLNASKENRMNKNLWFFRSYRQHFTCGLLAAFPLIFDIFLWRSERFLSRPRRPSILAP